MGYRNTSVAYGTVSKFFHWLIFLLVLFMLIYGYFMGEVAKEYKPLAFNIHKLVGLLILAVMILRVIWALINVKPALQGQVSFLERVAERLVHFLLYLALLIMPLSGWIGSSAANKAPYLGNLTFALPIAQNKITIDTAFTIHNTLAIIIIVLVCIHILAALYHHFFRKDEILRRMMPHTRHR